MEPQQEARNLDKLLDVADDLVRLVCWKGRRIGWQEFLLLGRQLQLQPFLAILRQQFLLNELLAKTIGFLPLRKHLGGPGLQFFEEALSHHDPQGTPVRRHGRSVVGRSRVLVPCLRNGQQGLKDAALAILHEHHQLHLHEERVDHVFVLQDQPRHKLSQACHVRWLRLDLGALWPAAPSPLGIVALDLRPW